MTKITINDQLIDFDPPTISYEKVVELAGFSGKEYHVTYTCKRDDLVQSSGNLKPGFCTYIRDVMLFRISHAGNA